MMLAIGDFVSSNSLGKSNDTRDSENFIVFKVEKNILEVFSGFVKN